MKEIPSMAAVFGLYVAFNNFQSYREGLIPYGMGISGVLLQIVQTIMKCRSIPPGSALCVEIKTIFSAIHVDPAWTGNLILPNDSFGDELQCKWCYTMHNK